MARTILRSAGTAIVVCTFVAVGSSKAAWAATIDCETINAASAAGVLGVPKAKSNPSQGHHAQPPDNMDVFSCGSANGQTFDGSIVFHGATNIVVLKVAGMPSADAAKAALLKAGNILAKA